MKKEKIKILVLLGIVLIISILLIMIVIVKFQRKNEDKMPYVIMLEDGTKLNIGKRFNKSKKYKNLKIDNMQYTEKDGITVLLADVTNISKEKYEEEIVKLTFIGNNEETIAEINPIIEQLEPGETKKINVSITGDLSSAIDFTVEEK